jgi:hypothetical protein
MNKYVLETDTCLTSKEVIELGLEEVTEAHEPSLEEANQGGDSHE